MKRNIVHDVTRKYMMQNKKRTITAFVGIVFMVLLMTCVFVGKDTAVAFMQEAASAREGKWHYAFYQMNGSQLKELESLDFVKETGQSFVLGMTEFAQSANKKRPYLNVKAYGEKCFDWYQIKISQGRLPKNGREIIISNACRKDGAKIKTGDKLDAAFFQRTVTGLSKNRENKIIFPFYNFFEIAGGQTKTAPEQFPYFEPNDDYQENKVMTGRTGSYTVVGFMEAPVYEKKDGAGYTAFTLLEQEMLSDTDLRNVSIQTDLKRIPENAVSVFGRIAGLENVDTNDYYMAFSGNSSDSTMNRMVNMLTVFLVALIAFASVILIYNVFQLSFRERCRYLGMLSSVGATAKQRRSSIYYEAFCLLSAAVPVGMIGGFGVIQCGMMLLKPFLLRFLTADGFQIQQIPVVLQISWKGIAAAAAASIATVLLSSFLPARNISRAGAVESIRGNENRKNKRRGYQISRFAYYRHGAVKMLAANTLSRQRRKKRGISVSVTVFLVILIVTAFTADTVHLILDKKTSGSYIMESHLKEKEGILSDLSHAGMEETESEMQRRRQRFLAVKEELRGHENVQSMKEWYTGVWCGQIYYRSNFFSQEYMDARMNIAKAYLGKTLSEEEITKRYVADSDSTVSILAVDDDTLAEIAARCGADNRLLSDVPARSVIIAEQMELSTDTMGFEGKKPDRYLYYDIAHATDLRQGEQFPVQMYHKNTGENKQMLFTAAGFADHAVLEDYVSLSGPWLIMGQQAAKALAKELGYGELPEMFEESVRITFQKDSEVLTAYLKSLNENEDHDIAFLDKDTEGMHQTMGQAIAWIVDIMLICFAALTSVICFLNLGNAVGGRMAVRGKEFAILKSVGMTDGQMRQMLFWECSGILLAAFIQAAAVSLLLICGIRYVLSSLFGRLALQIPAGFMICAAAAAAGSVFVMTFSAFHNMKMTNLSAQLRQD